MAYERRNRDLDPQLVWRGKDEKDWSDLLVQAPPLYIQEKVQPKVLIDDLMRETREHKETGQPRQLNLFADFNGIPSESARTEFYQHDANWSNRMVLGDSLQVMASLAERDGLRGQVQCIYIDPPYGIKFNSNFQWSTTNREVKDGKVDHITREPEQVKAFRDTWREGIHSYLAYLRDRLTVARDALTRSGSVFVQIGEENVHRIRVMMDEVFGEENFVAQVSFRKKLIPLGAKTLEGMADYLVWYARSLPEIKYRQLCVSTEPDPAGRWTGVQEPSGQLRRLTKEENKDFSQISPGTRVFGTVSQWAPSFSEKSVYSFTFDGRKYVPTSGRCWVTTDDKMQRLSAVFLARANPDARVLLSTFSDTLANALRTKLKRLISNEPRLGERVEVHAMNAIGRRLYELHFGQVQLASRETVRQLIDEGARAVGGHKFSLHFLMTEWEQVVDAWQLESWEAYRDVKRLGRKTRLPEKQRVVLWSIFDRVRASLKSRNLVTTAAVFSRLAAKLEGNKRPPFNFAVVDEAQDIAISQLRFLAALASDRPNSLFFANDLGQRIFQQSFSWKALGIDVRGRSHTLRINYRTSHQIRMQADRLLAHELSDVDGNMEERRGTISVFNGPRPAISVLDTQEDETETVGKWLQNLIKERLLPQEIGVFVRSATEMDRARAAVKNAGLSFKVLDEHVETISGHVSISTMHLGKGLEFRAVVVMACDDEVIPLQERIETVGDDADLEEVYNTERHLLYVACTRARDHLLVPCVAPASEFLDDLRI